MGSGKMDDNMAKQSVSVSPKSQKDVRKVISAENAMGNKLAEILSIRNDPAKLERMTVPELRTALRNVGAPTKGRKQELVSALKSILDGGIDAGEKPSSEEQLCDVKTSTAQEATNRGIQASVSGLTLDLEASKSKGKKKTCF